MRALYSSDQCAPGFRLALTAGCGGGGVLSALGDFRAPTFSLSVTRGDAGLEGEFELSMQLLGTYCNWLSGSLAYVAGANPLRRPRSVLYSMPCGEYQW